MRSKTSFFNRTVFLNDCARYWPLTAGYTLLWLLILPLSRLTQLQYAYRQTAWDIQHETLGIAAGAGCWVAFFTAILFAMAAFSYLTNPRATNGLHALSARRETLFVTHWLSGLCCQLAAQLLAVLLTAAVLGSRGAFDARIMCLSLLALALPTLFFYSFGSLCMMFTGQILAAPVFYLALNVLVVGVEMLVRNFAGNFLYGWAESSSPLLDFLSPIVKLSENVRVSGTANEYYSDAYASGLRHGGTILLQGLNWLLIYAAVGLVLTALALLLYRARHSEATGSIVAIGWARPVFQYGVAFCAALALGQLLYYLFFGQYRHNGNYSLVGTLLCMAAAGLLGYFVAEMLLKKSFRVWKSGWRGALVVTAVLVALGVVLSLDLTGYEGFVPNAAQVQNASVEMNIYSGNNSCYVTTDNADTIRFITEAHRALVNDKNYQQSVRQPGWMNGTSDAYGYFSVSYTLKNGSVVQRRYNPIALSRGSLGDPASPAAALTALYNEPNVTLARTLGKYGYSFYNDPNSLTDLRFTGGYIDAPHMENGTYRYSGEVDLAPIEAQMIYEAVLRDVAAGHVNDSLFSEGTQSFGHIELYATYLNTRDYGSPAPSTAPAIDENGRTSVSFSPMVTETMTETIGALRVLGIEPFFG